MEVEAQSSFRYGFRYGELIFELSFDSRKESIGKMKLTLSGSFEKSLTRPEVPLPGHDFVVEAKHGCMTTVHPLIVWFSESFCVEGKKRE